MTARNAALSIAVAFAALAPATTARAEFHFDYPIQHLAPNDAEMLLRVRLPELGDSCTVAGQTAPGSALFKGVVMGTCKDDALKPKIEAALAAIDVAPPTQRFHVAVLGASRKEGPAPELMPSEAKALADFKKVMTYKSFHLDAEAVLNVAHGAEARMSDAYQLTMQVEPSTAGGGSIEVRAFQLRAAEPKQMPSGSAGFTTYVETSFSIMRGETVVLGASISDQEARVVLVTALP